MLRVREVPERAVARAEKLAASDTCSTNLPRVNRPVRTPARLLAMTALGLSLGAGGAVFTVSLVQAEDDSGIRGVQRMDASNRQAQRAPQQASYASTRASAYAPASTGWHLPLLQMAPDGRIAHPPIALNPFKARPAVASSVRSANRSKTAAVRLDTVSGAADTARTICVRLCDGFQAPIGYLNAQSDLPAHEALCQAMNPGIPVKVFRVAAGATTIDDAQAADGKRYSALPVAYGYETSTDAAACRPAIVQAGERRVSLLRDFTLRAGDSVVLDGKVQTFTGGSRWPYSPRDFRDFRSATELSKSQRQQIDERVGVTRMEAQASSLRRQMRLREASLHDDSIASDAIPLRGSIDPSARGPVRLITIADTSGR
jgi:hypothetical protein